MKKALLFLLVVCTFIQFKVALCHEVERPVPNKAIVPVYPAKALHKQIFGVVLVDAQVNQTGEVTSATAIVGHEYLSASAVRAAKRWHFKPFKTANQLYTVRLTFIFHDPMYRPSEENPDFESPYQIEIFYPGPPKTNISVD